MDQDVVKVFNESFSLQNEQPEEELFNIHPRHRYQPGMTNFHQARDDYEEFITLQDIDLSEGKGYQTKKVYIGPFKKRFYRKRVWLGTEPVLDNQIKPEWSIITILNRKCPPGWRNVFKLSYKEFNNKILPAVAKSKSEGKRILPDNRNIFRAFDLCPLSKVKVVIFGQDPYHSVTDGTPDANGLAFSTNKGKKLRPSLRNIYKELRKSGFSAPDHGDLTAWALQGVLLLNTALTVPQSSPGKHLVPWRNFTHNIIQSLNKLRPNTVYLLWGRPARALKSKINDQDFILESTHPGPLSYPRTKRRPDSFEGNNHFVLANQILEQTGQTTIDWNLK